MTELANYEDAYKGLSDLVQTMSGNKSLIEAAKELDEIMITNHEEQNKQDDSLTKKEILLIKDSVERQNAIKENMHLFN